MVLFKLDLILILFGLRALFVNGRLSAIKVQLELESIWFFFYVYLKENSLILQFQEIHYKLINFKRKFHYFSNFKKFITN